MNGLYAKQDKCNRCGLTRDIADLHIDRTTIGDVVLSVSLCKDNKICDRFLPLVKIERAREIVRTATKKMARKMREHLVDVYTPESGFTYIGTAKAGRKKARK